MATIKQFLIYSSQELKDESPTPFLDMEILASHVLKKDRSYLYTHPELMLSDSQIKKLSSLENRRRKGEPIAYIVNKKEFYGLEFYIDRNVLIPRQETETLVELLLKTIGIAQKTIVADIGTGSGCIGISIAKYSNAKVFATDISSKALKIAKLNSIKNGVENKITFDECDILPAYFRNKENFFMISNLPYVNSRSYKNLPRNVKKYEPKIALEAGKDGLRYYKKLFKALRKNNLKPNHLFLEIDPYTENYAKDLARRAFPASQVQIKKDLNLRSRYVIVKL